MFWNFTRWNSLSFSSSHHETENVIQKTAKISTDIHFFSSATLSFVALVTRLPHLANCWRRLGCTTTAVPRSSTNSIRPVGEYSPSRANRCRCRIWRTECTVWRCRMDRGRDWMGTANMECRISHWLLRMHFARYFIGNVCFKLNDFTSNLLSIFSHALCVDSLFREVFKYRKFQDIQFQPLPAAAQNLKYKTKFCRNEEDSGTCPYGARCLFLHRHEVDVMDEVVRRMNERMTEMKGERICRGRSWTETRQTGMEWSRKEEEGQRDRRNCNWIRLKWWAATASATSPASGWIITIPHELKLKNLSLSPESSVHFRSDRMTFCCCCIWIWILKRF